MPTAPSTSASSRRRVFRVTPLGRLLGLSVALALLLSALWSSRAEAGIKFKCPPSLRGCASRCCFICYLTYIAINDDGTYDCGYDDCYTYCV
jgi:hypothetical protein